MITSNTSINRSLARIALLGLSLAAISACSQGGSTQDAAPAANTRDVQGAVIKGPVRGATIDIFEIDADGQAIEPALTSTQTDPEGKFSISGLPDVPLLARSRGGSFYDESDPSGQRRIELSSKQGFETFIAQGETRATLNPYTQTLVDKLRQQSASDDVPMASLIEGGRALFLQAFGFDILTTIPADPIAPQTGVSRAQLNYAMALGGYANAVNSMISQRGMAKAEFDYIRALSADLSDGAQDSKANEPINVAGEPLPAIDLNNEIKRFRNNNNPAYAGVEAFAINLSALAGDAAHGPVVGFAQAEFSAAESAQELSVSLSVVPAASSSFTLQIVSIADSATSGVDYPAIDQIISVAPNQSSVSFDLAFLDDDEVEADEQFKLRLINPRGATLGPDDEMLIVILNDDAAATPSPTPTLSPTPTPTPSATPTATPSPTPTATPTATPSPTPTTTPTPTPTPTATPTPTPASISVAVSTVLVEDKSRVRLLPAHLSASDPQSTAPPVFTVPSPNTSGIEFYLPEDRDTPASSFTQADINSGRVLLVPDLQVVSKATMTATGPTLLSITLDISSDSGATETATLPAEVRSYSPYADYHLIEFALLMEQRNTGLAEDPSYQGVFGVSNGLFDSSLAMGDGSLDWLVASDAQFHAKAQASTGDPDNEASVSGEFSGLEFTADATPYFFLSGVERNDGHIDFTSPFKEIIEVNGARRVFPYTVRSLPLTENAFVSTVRDTQQNHLVINDSIYAPDLRSHSQQITSRMLIRKSDTADFFPLNGEFGFASIHMEIGLDSDGLGQRTIGSTLIETTISDDIASVNMEDHYSMRRSSWGGEQFSSPTTSSCTADCEQLTLSVMNDGGVLMQDTGGNTVRYGAIDEDNNLIALTSHYISSNSISAPVDKVGSTATPFTVDQPFDYTHHEISVGVRRFIGSPAQLESAMSDAALRVSGLQYTTENYDVAEALAELHNAKLTFGSAGAVSLTASASVSFYDPICESTPASSPPLLPVNSSVIRRTDELAELIQPSAVEEYCNSDTGNSAGHFNGSGTVTYGDNGRIAFSLGDHAYAGFVSHDLSAIVLTATYLDSSGSDDSLVGDNYGESGIALLIATLDQGFELNDIPPQRDLDQSCGYDLAMTTQKRLIRDDDDPESQEDEIVAPGDTTLLESCFEHFDLTQGTVVEIKQDGGGTYPTGTQAYWESTIPDDFFTDPDSDMTDWQAPANGSGRSFVNGLADNGVYQSVLSATIAFGEDCDDDDKIDDLEDSNTASCDD